MLLALVTAGSMLVMVWDGAAADETTTAIVRRGSLTVKLTMSGILRPLESTTYRSPLAGREAEIVVIVAEGTRVDEGDLLIRFDVVTLQRELDRANQELRQVQVDLQVAEIEWQEGQAAIDSLSEGEAALTIEETRTRLQNAERKVARLREEQQTLAPLMEKGFITREELRKTADELAQAEEDLALARRRTDVLVERTFPRERRKAELQLAQREAQRQNVRVRVDEMRARVAQLRAAIENASVYARHAGLVVHEENLAASPRRKIRLGDRVTESQGLVTIPQVNRMLVETSIGEADVQRVRPGQPATVVLEAFRDRDLTGRVTRVGTLARASAERSFDDKRFDLIVELDPSDIDLRPEMTARVDVFVAERPNALLVPVNAVFERQGLPVLHVFGRFGVDTRPVRVGETGDGMTEVLAGVAEGERIMLVDVASTAAPQAAPAGQLQGVPPAAGAIGGAGRQPR
jgi:multidrug resistance efflux pump